MAFFPTDRPAAPGLPGVFAGLTFGNALSALNNWNSRRVTRHELSQLSDRQLEDIGLRRSGIDAAVRQLR